MLRFPSVEIRFLLLPFISEMPSLNRLPWIKSQTIVKLESTELLNNLLLNFTIWSASTIY